MLGTSNFPVIIVFYIYRTQSNNSTFYLNVSYWAKVHSTVIKVFRFQILDHSNEIQYDFNKKVIGLYSK
jgi:hypothetical protein